MTLRTTTAALAALLMVVIPGAGGAQQDAPPSAPATGFSHDTWDDLLRRHVLDGRVNYPGFIVDRALLDAYLAAAAVAEPGGWSREEQMAFWINMYNARMIASVLDHWPLESVLDVGKILFIPTLKIFKEKHPIAGKPRSLDDIEHGILRKRFKDARIHATLVCASRSCPALESRAYTAGDLDARLDRAMNQFLSDVRRNRIFETPPRVSKIFKWYGDDFRAEAGTVWGYIRSRLSPEEQSRYPETTKIKYLSYDWKLNR